MIEQLPIAFKAKERIYRQLARKGIVALYEVRNFRHILIGFELILVRYQKAHDGKRGDRYWTYPEREKYPNNEQFGRYAWSIPNSLPLAELLFDHLAARMARNRSDFDSQKDYYAVGFSGQAWREIKFAVREFMTGRPLPRTGFVSNRTPEPTERLATNDDSRH